MSWENLEATCILCGRTERVSPEEALYKRVKFIPTGLYVCRECQAAQAKQSGGQEAASAAHDNGGAR